MNKYHPGGPSTALARTLCTVVFLLIAGTQIPVSAQPAGIPQIPAFLPTMDQVPGTQPMPLDGTWLINTIHKKIRIEAGRAYAVDSWLHLFVLKVDPGMVVIQNITPTAAGEYSGDDLPLMGKWTAKVQADRSLSVSVASTLGPINYKLIPMQLDNPQWYAQEMTAAGLTVTAPYQPSQPAYQPAPPPQQPTYQPAPPPQQPGYQPAPPAQQPGYQPAPPAQQPGYPPAPPAQAPAQPGPAPTADLSNCKKLDVDKATGKIVCLD